MRVRLREERVERLRERERERERERSVCEVERREAERETAGEVERGKVREQNPNCCVL